ncbi:hypothetical protein RRG08_058974 [Elysia crispata]|uniref:Uncharacterized protein n=1 Tax=Elysia crispata TaxID=231223 RepID=A0AAE0YHW8_9GAST|nr:hypothetical protein RRG08_058974 [Elysia crispata]
MADHNSPNHYIRAFLWRRQLPLFLAVDRGRPASHKADTPSGAEDSPYSPEKCFSHGDRNVMCGYSTLVCPPVCGNAVSKHVSDDNLTMPT